RPRASVRRSERRLRRMGCPERAVAAAASGADRTTSSPPLDRDARQGPIRRPDHRYFPLTLLNNVLGQYALGGRLGDNIRERQGMAYYVFSSFDANVAEGPLVIRAGVNPDEVERMARGGVTPQELADSKRYLIGSMPRTLETNAGIASFLHDADYFGLG